MVMTIFPVNSPHQPAQNKTYIAVQINIVYGKRKSPQAHPITGTKKTKDQVQRGQVCGTISIELAYPDQVYTTHINGNQ